MSYKEKSLLDSVIFDPDNSLGLNISEKIKDRRKEEQRKQDDERKAKVQRNRAYKEMKKAINKQGFSLYSKRRGENAY